MAEQVFSRAGLRRRSRVIAIAFLAAALVPAMGASVAGAEPTDDRGQQIVGGDRANISEYPWTVMLTQASGFQFCGGTLVSPTKVVTAAHCVKGTSAGSVRVVAGREDKNDTKGTVAKVAKIWVHPQYASVEKGHDAAMLTLDAPIEDAKTLPIATAADGEVYKPGTNTTVLGWGATASGGQASRYLLKVDVPITTDEACSASYGGRYLKDSMVCAGLDAGGKDSCQGDSGGPLIAGGKLIGIVSWGDGCASPKKYGVYTRVSTYSDLFKQQLEG